MSELLALNLEDINIENQKFQVLGKGNKQRGRCFYSDVAANALVEYLNHSRHKSTNALFTAQHPVTPIAAIAKFKPFGRKDWSSKERSRTSPKR
ncbi:MAG: hypothetical protein HC836_10445 [Richelia sp. RM2_1_2]|nr:hypothetical protein [Richelia sp. SM2_1_7]NJM17357.1 hypothetical protein [Richelia sp. SM1_7_0]NJN09474.1 hypothetical protein [Richelia sp. RM1_1_1]NJO26867.1 hypothetical protein [Richelia sp. SL_2_1]NJO58739.1 hypothetical protein [Richelia sp. RM2_1_2]